MAGTHILEYDKDNKHIEYKYMAKCKERNDWHIGWIVIEKPWYSPQDQWKYHIVHNDYKPGGFCGGAIDLGLKTIEVRGDSIKEFNQVNQVKLEMEDGTLNVKLDNYPIKGESYIIEAGSKVPYELWNKGRDYSE